MNERFKQFLKRSIFLGGLALSGCEIPSAQKSEPIVFEFTKREYKEWQEVFIPADDQAVSIPGIRKLQSSYIGLQELYIANSRVYPLIYILSVWDPNVVRIQDQGAPNLFGTFGFQARSESFIPKNISLASQFLGNELDIDIQRGFDRVLPSFLSYTGTAEQAALVGARRRPKGENVLVFGEGSVEYNGIPSPLSHILLSFTFEESNLGVPIPPTAA